MFLRGIVNNVTQTVNSNISVNLLRSSGYTIGAGARQVPSYSAPESLLAQVQALDSDDLKQIDGLNIQGTLRSIYIYGVMLGVVRPNQTGGDIVEITDMPGFVGTRKWLVTKVLESWPDWSKAVIVLQE